MTGVLVDTSIWIDYFRGAVVAEPLSELIDSNRVLVNDIILAELLPSIEIRKERRLRELLLAVRKVPLAVNWIDIVEMQRKNLRNGHNHVGIPDLLIAQNALLNELVLFENDKHFRPMNRLFGLKLLRK